ncbi:hypothetical protein EYF80_042791 [Liparis tanakae]|uniref:Uncharacterized protein n=1 Tax=Liparis tanakae TaxID=230148 RepID=A0A4Z2G1I4_9TELE|nr:hypothetical protein EYF80_042791 [Liparis tanakae]
MQGVKGTACVEAFPLFTDRSSSEPVEDTDTTSFVAEFSLEANYPVQVTDPNDAVTLHLSSMPSGFLSPSDRIRQAQRLILCLDVSQFKLLKNAPARHRLHQVYSFVVIINFLH